MRAIAIFVMAMLLAGAAHAGQHTPRVLSEHNADSYSMKTFRQFHKWKDLKGDKLAWAVYRYLTDKRTGIYPMGAGAWEGPETMYDYRLIRDPVKNINIYSVGYCDVLGPTMEGIWKNMGLGPARTVNLPQWHHVVTEVNYDDKWHYLDLDIRLAFRRKDGTLASFEESKVEDEVWQYPNSNHFLPKDNVRDVQEKYKKFKAEYRHGVSMGGHTMDYYLRSGETLTRWWTPQGGRWNHNETYHQESKLRILERNPVGPKCKHPNFTIHTHGNGRFVYAPDLTSASQDFTDGAYHAINVTAGNQGLALEKSGQGHAIFEVRSPYVIVPVVGKYKSRDDDKDASVIEIDEAGVDVSISQDTGISWNKVKIKDGRIDLTQHVSGTYGYLLKLNFKDMKSVVRKLKVTTWVQLHPASLPSLRKGDNRMEFVNGDHHKLATRVVEVRPFASDKTEFLKFMHKPPTDYDPSRKTSRIRGEFIARLDAPLGTKIAWFSAGGSFQTHQGKGAKNTRNSMAYALDSPRNFKEFYRAAVPDYMSHWHYNADIEVKPTKSGKTLFVKYHGDPAVNNIRIFAHCLDEKPVLRSPVTITHIWEENGKRKSKIVKASKAKTYKINCTAEPTDVSIELSIPSSRK